MGRAKKLCLSKAASEAYRRPLEKTLQHRYGILRSLGLESRATMGAERAKRPLTTARLVLQWSVRRNYEHRRPIEGHWKKLCNIDTVSFDLSAWKAERLWGPSEATVDNSETCFPRERAKKLCSTKAIGKNSVASTRCPSISRLGKPSDYGGERLWIN